MIATHTEHRLTSAWGGPPGECGAECACGVVYDGFDTIAEAETLLNEHVAQQTPAEPTPADIYEALLDAVTEYGAGRDLQAQPITATTDYAAIVAATGQRYRDVIALAGKLRDLAEKGA